jgi:hypothetical protein
MMRLNVFLVVFVLVVVCTNCESTSDNNELPEREKIVMDQEGVIHGGSTAQYVGSAGELIVIAENTVLTPELFTFLDTTFGDYILPYYPPQQKFELKHITPEKFQRGSRRIRNLLLIELDESIPAGKPKMVIKKDYFARTQLLTEIRAHSMSDLMELLHKEVEGLVKRYEAQEWKREFYRHKKDNNQSIKKQLVKQFGITLELPAKARFESNKNSFAKIMFPDRSRQMEMQGSEQYSASRANFIQSGIMIWTIPFSDSNQLTPDYLMRARDTILKYNALHEFPGVYMGTQDHPAVVPVHQRIKIGEVEGYEFRGLYKFTGRLEPSGGKFWSFHFLHPKRQVITAISGYLDAPPTMNPAFDLRRIQAVIYSLKIAE